MLIPINREKFEQLIPLIATGLQYNYTWGKARDFLNRLLISVLGVVVVWVMSLFFKGGFDAIALMLGVAAGFYWLWGPIYWASRRNSKFRDYKYSGFWRGRVLNIYVTEELTREEEDVNQKGELVIIENRERRLNIEVGDETGFRVELQVPLKRLYKQIARGQVAEMLVVGYQPSLNRLESFTDIYLPERNLWVSDYPYLQRQIFEQLSQQISLDRPPKYPPKYSPKYPDNNYRDEEEYEDYDDYDLPQSRDADRDSYDRESDFDDRYDRYRELAGDQNYEDEYDEYGDRSIPPQLPPRRQAPRESRKSIPVKNRRSKRTSKRRPRP